MAFSENFKEDYPFKEEQFELSCPLRGLCTIKMGKLPDNVPENLLSLKLCLTIQYSMYCTDL
jgi:hypothetical protein